MVDGAELWVALLLSDGYFPGGILRRLQGGSEWAWRTRELGPVTGDGHEGPISGRGRWEAGFSNGQSGSGPYPVFGLQ